MPRVRDPAIGDYLAGLMTLVLRASPGPFAIRRTAGSEYAVTAADGGRSIATFTREADAQLFAQLLPDLRALAAAAAEVLSLHRDDGRGLCVQEGQPAPCTTRRTIMTQLAPRAAAS